ncbi:M23 family metallopeptidase [Palleronia sp. LCG004]|uniref:M23 family metallopeptidase n=1 Tax=Palleronia sp. LCG004 TaxID=3079304 RepID=UPI002942670E|nr:M23 family metallopeptidase [Palleronia sp. LCG004]WOI55289.1 M23 family metallopeptidase [Palleronia sp. LCG004]
MLRAALLSIVLVWPGIASAQRSETCYGLLCIIAETRDASVILSARNASGHAPITAALTLDLDNMIARGVANATLRPGEIRDFVTLTPSGSPPYEYRYRYQWVPGDTRARPDPGATYALPFRRAALPVVQSCGGWFSHRGEADQAVDFGMPIGTPVHAARTGRVVMVRTDSREGGRARRFIGRDNTILIEHADGSIANYAHLSYRSARVAEGESVQAGDMIALSGNTGYSASPHLHFELYTPLANGGRKSWPVAWRIGGERVLCPRRGTILRN